MPSPEVTETELDRVVTMRREAMERAGFPFTSALELANRDDVDWHRAVELVENGCPHQTAFEILT